MRVYIAAAMMLTAVLAGCASGDDDSPADAATDPSDDQASSAPMLYLNLTIGNQSYSFSSLEATGSAGGGASPGTANGTATASATASNTTASGNATAGNQTASGNATATPGNGTDSGPSGTAPLDVFVTLGASNLPMDGNGTASVSWNLDFGDSGSQAPPSANATGNATGNTTTGNSTGNATGNTTGNPPGGHASGPTNGTTLPATSQHTYTTAGTYELTFTLSGPNGTLESLMVTVTVTGPSAGNATDGNATGPAPDPIVIEGSAFGVMGLPGDSEETFELNANVAAMTITLEFSGTGNDLDWSIAGPGGESAEGDNSGAEDPVTFEAPSVGTWTVTIVPYRTVGPVDYTITVTFA